MSARTDVTMKVANTTGQDTKVVADNLTALWNSFNVGAEEAELYVDRIAKLAATTATDVDEMTTAMAKNASMAQTMGISEEQLAAQMSTVISVTRQAPESIGTAFKSIYARMEDIKTGADDAEISLGNYSSKLAVLGINVLDATGTLRDLGEVIEEVGNHWETYTREQQTVIASTMGGQRQINQVMALFDNWDDYNKAIETMADSEGYLNEQQKIYMESAVGQLQKLRTEWEGVLDSLLSSDDIIKVAKAISPILTSLEKVIDTFGGGIGILSQFAPLLFSLVSPEISKGIAKIGINFSAVKNNAETAKQELEALDFYFQNQLGKNARGNNNPYTQVFDDILKEYSKVRDSMSAEQKNKFQETLQRIAKETAPAVTKAIDEVYSEIENLQKLGLDDKNMFNADSLARNSADDFRKMSQDFSDFSKGIFNRGTQSLGFNFNSQDLENIKSSLKNLVGDSSIGQKFAEALDQGLSAVKADDLARQLDEALDQNVNFGDIDFADQVKAQIDAIYKDEEEIGQRVFENLTERNAVYLQEREAAENKLAEAVDKREAATTQFESLREDFAKRSERILDIESQIQEIENKKIKDEEELQRQRDAEIADLQDQQQKEKENEEISIKNLKEAIELKKIQQKEGVESRLREIADEQKITREIKEQLRLYRLAAAERKKDNAQRSRERYEKELRENPSMSDERKAKVQKGIEKFSAREAEVQEEIIKLKVPTEEIENVEIKIKEAFERIDSVANETLKLGTERIKENTVTKVKEIEEKIKEISQKSLFEQSEEDKKKVEALKSELEDLNKAQEAAGYKIAETSVDLIEASRQAEGAIDRINELNAKRQVGNSTQQFQQNVIRPEALEELNERGQEVAGTMETVSNNTNNAAQSMQKAEDTSRKAANGLKSVEESLSEIKWETVGQGLASVAQGFAAIASIVNTVKSLTETLWDEDLTPGEKLLKILAALPALIFSVTSAVNGFKNITTLTTIAQKIFNEVLAVDVKQIRAEIVAKNASKRASIAAATQDMIEAGATGVNTASKAANTKATQSNTVAEGYNAVSTGAEAAAKDAETGAEIRNTAAKQGNTAATGSALMAGGALLAVLAAILVALTAYSIYLYKVSQNTEKLEKAMDKEKEKVQETIDKYKELKETNDAYNEILEKQKKLTKGTEEYNEALKEQVELSEELIEKDPTLARFMKYTQTGERVLDTESENYKRYLEEQEGKADEAQRDVYKKGLISTSAPFGMELFGEETPFKFRNIVDFASNGEISKDYMGPEAVKDWNAALLEQMASFTKELKNVDSRLIDTVIKNLQTLGMSSKDIADAIENNADMILEATKKIEENAERTEFNGVAVGAGDLSTLSEDDYKRLLIQSESDPEGFLKNFGVDTEYSKLMTLNTMTKGAYADIIDFNKSLSENFKIIEEYRMGEAKTLGERNKVGADMEWLRKDVNNAVIDDQNRLVAEYTSELMINHTEQIENVLRDSLIKNLTDVAKVSRETLNNYLNSQNTDTVKLLESKFIPEVDQLGISTDTKERLIEDLSAVNWSDSTQIDEFTKKWQYLDNKVLNDTIKKLESINKKPIALAKGMAEAAKTISGLSFESTVKKDDYDELIKSFEGIDKYLQKIGDDYIFVGDNALTVHNLMKQQAMDAINQTASVSQRGLDILNEETDYYLNKGHINDLLEDDEILNIIAESEGGRDEAKELVQKAIEGDKVAVEELKEILENETPDSTFALAWNIAETYEEFEEIIGDVKLSEERLAAAKKHFHNQEIERLKEIKSLYRDIEDIKINTAKEDAQRYIDTYKEEFEKGDYTNFDKYLEEQEKYRVSLDKEIANKNKQLDDLNSQRTEKIKGTDMSFDRLLNIYDKFGEDAFKNLFEKHFSPDDFEEILQKIKDYRSEEASLNKDIKDLTEEKADAEKTYTKTLQETNEELKRQDDLTLKILDRQSKIAENRMAHLTGQDYLDAYYQNENIKSQKADIYQGQINRNERRMAQMEDYTGWKYLEKQGDFLVVSDTKGLTQEQIDDAQNLANEYNDLISTNYDLQNSIEDLNEESLVTVDLTANINRRISQTTKELEQLKKEQTSLTGDALIENLREQAKLEEKLKKENEEKLEILKAINETTISTAKAALSTKGINLDDYKQDDGTIDVVGLLQKGNELGVGDFVNNWVQQILSTTDALKDFEDSLKVTAKRVDSTYDEDKKLKELDKSDKEQDRIIARYPSWSKEYKEAEAQKKKNQEERVATLKSNVKEKEKEEKTANQDVEDKRGLLAQELGIDVKSLEGKSIEQIQKEIDSGKIKLEDDDDRAAWNNYIDSVQAADKATEELTAAQEEYKDALEKTKPVIRDIKQEKDDYLERKIGGYDEELGDLEEAKKYATPEEKIEIEKKEQEIKAKKRATQKSKAENLADMRDRDGILGKYGEILREQNIEIIRNPDGTIANIKQIRDALGKLNEDEQKAFEDTVKRDEELGKEIEDINDELKTYKLPYDQFQDYNVQLNLITKTQEKLNQKIAKTNNELSMLESEASFLYGDSLIENMEAQIDCLEEQTEQKKEQLEIDKKQIELAEQNVANRQTELKYQGQISQTKIDDIKKGLNLNDYLNEDGTVNRAKLSQDLGQKVEDVEGLETALNDYDAAAKNYADATSAVIDKENAQLETEKALFDIEQKRKQLYIDLAKKKLEMAEEVIKRETTANHDLAKALREVDKEINKCKRDQSDLSGPALIAKLQEEIQLQLKKKNILEQQAKVIKNQATALATLYSNFLSSQYGISAGIKFDESGVINWDSLYAEAEKLPDDLKGQYIQDVSDYGGQVDSLASSAASAEDNISSLTDSIEDLEKQIKKEQEAEAFRVKDEKWYLEEQEIKKIQKEIAKLQREQNHLTGHNLLNNLEKQQELLKKQAAAEQRKLSIMKQELAVQQALLASKGAAFTADGFIANYAELIQKGDSNLSSYLSSYNSLLDQINDLQTEIEDTLAEAEELEWTKAEERLRMFNAKVDVELDLGKAKREWLQFKREFLNTLSGLSELNDSIIEKAKNNMRTLYDLSAREAPMLTEHVNEIMNEIAIMQGGGWSKLYGTDQQKALEELSNYRQQLQETLSGAADAIKEVEAAYLEQIGRIKDKFDEQKSDFETIQKIIEHDMNIIKILHGDDSYKELTNYYEKSADNYEKEISLLRKEVDQWKQLLDEAEPGSERWNTFKTNWESALDELNSAVESAIDNLMSKYENAIREIMDRLANSVTANRGTDWTQQLWDWNKEEADFYIDEESKLYEIEKLRNKISKAINDADDPARKAKILKIGDEQIKQLQAMEKLRRYDVDLANKRIDLELKKLELENAGDNKTTMRLRRDTEGNYRYEYVADEDKINDLKQDILDAQEEIRLFTIKNQRDLQDELMSMYKDYEDSIIELNKIRLQIGEEEYQKRLAELNEHYSFIDEAIRAALQKGAEDVTTETMKEAVMLDMITQQELNNMAEIERRMMTDEIVPTFTSAITQMADAIAGEGGLAKMTETALSELNVVFDQLVSDLEDIENVASISFDTITEGVDVTIDEMYELIDQNDTLLEQYQNELEAIEDLIDQLHNLIDTYGDVYDAAIEAIDAALELRKIEINRASDTNANDSYAIASAASSSSAGQFINNTKPRTVTTTTTKATISPEEDRKNAESYKMYGVGVRRTNFEDNQGNQLTKEAGTKILDVANFGANVTNSLLSKNGQNNSAAYSSNDIISLETVNVSTNAGLEDSGDIITLNDKQKKKIRRYATGGYTGEWTSDNGRLAILHQKELVLNQDDTENLLAAIKSLNENNNIQVSSTNIIDTVRNKINNFVNALDTLTYATIAAADQIKQAVVNNNQTISNTYNTTANFPNAGNMNEIKNAIMNLPNYVTQQQHMNKRAAY